MSKISIVMPVYNAEMFVKEAIESTLKQSFADFEFIIVDDGSTDKTLSIIRTFEDKRIKLIQNEHNYIDSLNLGMDKASGKYIARMDADDIMHIERLKIQLSIMESEPKIAVCGTWMNRFSTNIQSDGLVKSLSGLIKQPLLEFLHGNCVFHPTTMLRTEFLRKHNLKYEDYLAAEDFKFFTEIAKLGGQFYIENQPLHYYRIPGSQVSTQKKEEQKETTELIINEVLEYLLKQNENRYPELPVIFREFKKLQKKAMMSKQEVNGFFHNFFQKIKVN